MKLNDLMNHTSEWLKGTGPNSDIVISSRIRLARNLDKYPFPHWAKKEQSQEVNLTIEEAKAKVDFLKNTTTFQLAGMDAVDKQFFVERHLMSYEHAQRQDSKAVIIDDEEIISIMVNEEDHMRIQVMQSGFNIFEAWNIINRIDDALSQQLSYAFSSEWGYLTCCPTNTGTGMRGPMKAIGGAGNCQRHFRPGAPATKPAAPRAVDRVTTPKGNQPSSGRGRCGGAAALPPRDRRQLPPRRPLRPCPCLCPCPPERACGLPHQARHP